MRNKKRRNSLIKEKKIEVSFNKQIFNLIENFKLIIQRVIKSHQRKPKMEKTPNKIKLTFLGDSGVGKTSIVNQFNNNSFNPSSEHTVGIDFISKNIDFKNNNIRIFIYDTVFI